MPRRKSDQPQMDHEKKVAEDIRHHVDEINRHVYEAQHLGMTVDFSTTSFTASSSSDKPRTHILAVEITKIIRF